MFSVIQRLRDRDREGGFTLIELMVVVMIIAILMAIAIPAFLGARTRAQDSAAKSAIRNVVSEAQVIFSDGRQYPTTATLVTNLGEEEPNMNFVTAGSTGPKVISVYSNATTDTDGTGTTVVVGAKSKANNCFYLRHVSTGGATGGISQAVEKGVSGTCDTAAAAAADATLTWTAL